MISGRQIQDKKNFIKLPNDKKWTQGLLVKLFVYW